MEKGKELATALGGNPSPQESVLIRDDEQETSAMVLWLRKGSHE
jgi:hypothetical protein